MHTMVGFLEDIDPAAAAVNITALQDDHIFTQGDDLRVPTLNQILAVAGGISILGTFGLRLESPSLRDINRLVVNPVNHLADSDAEPSDPIALLDLSQHPRRLTTDEILQCVIDTNPAAAADQWAILVMGDGVQSQAQGEIITVRATGTTTVVARAWDSVALTFDDALPVGRYAVVGLRFISATAIAARLVFKPGAWRPGCIGVDSELSQDHPLFRMGRLGVWGEFASVTPPDIEVLCDVADTAQTFFLDLIPL